jgi:hypothetical protein
VIAVRFDVQGPTATALWDAAYSRLRDFDPGPAGPYEWSDPMFDLEVEDASAINGSGEVVISLWIGHVTALGRDRSARR